ncbi:MAG: TldD/PmbA family protein [Elusimicrobia bacterium]|nr:TldD/PmbA family protein [Elusimicrobiota bacterium]
MKMNVISQSDVDLILKKMLLKGGDFAEIYFAESEIAGFSFIDKKVETASSGNTNGVGLRLIKNGETYCASQSSPSVSTIISLAERLTGEPNQTKLNNTGQLKIEPSSLARLTGALHPYLKVIENTDKILRQKSKQIRQISFRISSGKKNFYVANSEKISITHNKESALFVIAVVVSSGNLPGQTQTAHEVIAESSLRKIKPEDIKEKSEVAFKRASDLLNIAVPPLAGEMTVVLSSSAGGTMIHEAIGHSLEADLVQKGISPVYFGKLGKKVASEKITVIDNPTLENLRGSYKYDDEGTLSQKTVLVEKGVLKCYLYDLLTAKKDGVKSTGNGRRESYHHKPIPRMSNTYISPGSDNPDDILKSVKKGIFVKRMGGGQVNTANGDFIFEVEEGYEIIDGKIGKMLRNASLIGNGPAVLNSIDMVGTDLGWQHGTCGKESQGAPVSDAQPTLRIPKITIGGI